MIFFSTFIKFGWGELRVEETSFPSRLTRWLLLVDR